MAEGKLRTVYFHFPFIGAGSAIAAESVECAGEQGQAHFWSMVDRLYETDADITKDSVKDEAGMIDGIDTDAFAACLTSGRHTTTWQLDRARGEAMGVNSTPTIFLTYVEPDGQEQLLQFGGGQEFGQFSKIIDAILERISE